MDIDNLIKEAILEKNSAKKEAYRAIKAELLLNNSSKNPKPEGKETGHFKLHCNDGSEFEFYTNELDTSIIRKQVQIREEQVSMYDANSRKDLADMYREQIKYFKELLPPEISKEQIKEVILAAFPVGYTQKEIGKVIKEVKQVYPTADNKLVSELAKKYML